MLKKYFRALNVMEALGLNIIEKNPEDYSLLVEKNNYLCFINPHVSGLYHIIIENDLNGDEMLDDFLELYEMVNIIRALR